MPKFEFVDVGPISELSIVAEPGTVTVLRGPNGSGKTTALGALSRLAGSKSGPALSHKDGSKKGTVTGEGVTIRLSPNGNPRRTGELQCEPVDEDLTIADIVEPGLRDPVANDRRRIEAVCAVLAIDPDASIFREGFDKNGVDLDGIASAKALEAADVVGMANQLKRDCDAKARELEGEIKELEGGAETIRQAIAEVDLKAPCDPMELDAAVDKANERLATLRERKRAAEASQEALDEIPNIPIEKVRAELRDLEMAIRDHSREHEEAVVKVERLQAELRKAEQELDAADAALRRANDSLKSAQERMKTAEGAAALRKAAASAPSEEEVQDAEAAVEAAKAARDRGVLIRNARQQKVQLASKESKANELRKRSELLRDLGKSCLSKLADLLHGTGFEVRDDERIWTEHPVRGWCHFQDLSMGERCTRAMQIAIESVRRREIMHGLLLVPQEFWEGLDETNRRVICDAVAGTDLSVITAEASGQAGDPVESMTL